MLKELALTAVAGLVIGLLAVSVLLLMSTAVPAEEPRVVTRTVPVVVKECPEPPFACRQWVSFEGGVEQGGFEVCVEAVLLRKGERVPVQAVVVPID